LIRAAALICLCLAFGPTFGLNAALALSPADIAALQAGEPVVDVSIDPKLEIARTRATIDIPVPAAQVWKIMTDCARALRYVPGLEKCRVLSRDPSGKWDIREHRINWAWFFPNVRTVIRSDYDAPKRVVYKMIEGTLRLSQGEWRLESRDNGRTTRVIHTSIVGAGVPAPNFMIVSAMKRDFITVMQRLRAESLAAGNRQAR
jgi:uncharacterized protein YndB with AHSA1/START domain